MADPMTAGAVVGGVGSLAGSGIDAIGQGFASAKDNAKGATMASNLADFISKSVLGDSMRGENAAIDKMIGQVTQGGNYSGIETAANEQLGRSSRALDASLAGRGVYDSGAALGAQSELRSNTIATLSDKIGQDRLARQQLAATLEQGRQQNILGRLGLAGQLFSNDSFGNYDVSTGKAANQGK